MKVNYDSNNSGGDWWLSDDDWKALEEAGWYVEWGGKYFCHSSLNFDNVPESMYVCASSDDCKGHRKANNAEEAEAYRRLGCLATSASKEGEVRDLLYEFERVTGQSVSDDGCNCCGAPHSFSWYDDKGDYQWCSGSDCLEYMYDKTFSLREAIELLNNQ